MYKTRLMPVKSPYKKINGTLRLVGHTHSSIDSNSSIFHNCICSTNNVADTHVYLGLHIDSKFNWSSHIDYVNNKLR